MCILYVLFLLPETMTKEARKQVRPQCLQHMRSSFVGLSAHQLGCTCAAIRPPLPSLSPESLLSVALAQQLA